VIKIKLPFLGVTRYTSTPIAASGVNHRPHRGSSFPKYRCHLPKQSLNIKEVEMIKAKSLLFTVVMLSCLGFVMLPEAGAANAKYDLEKFPDMSDYDPNNITTPKGDTVKIAIIAAFSGPAAAVGQSYLLPIGWAAHDINKRGGILVVIG
jgi:hypothetical protein